MKKDVLFEIGLEELPARFIDEAEKQLAEKTSNWLKELRISFDSMMTYATPRRLAVKINGLSEVQTTIEEELKGPSLKIAQDENGNWSKAALGFTKGQGKTTDDIYTKEIHGTTYIFVKKRIEGEQTIHLLPSFKDILMSLHFPQNMHWGREKIRYARPIRWLVALYGNEVIPFEIAHVKTSNETYGHRFLGEKIIIDEPNSYEQLLRDNYVIPITKQREEMILSAIKNIENEHQIHIPIDQELMNEVRNLVEYPTVFMGSFENRFLQLPEEVLIISMKEHQRYFPVKSLEGKLLPSFIGVRNGDEHGIEKVIKGNEKVLRARLSDAQFFYEEDQNKSIDEYQEKLGKVVFQEKLGTISDKINRVKSITKKIAQLLHLDEEQKEKAIRAAELSKFDLMTDMVNEFTELQGVMGEKYALIFNEDPAVAQAIREHYLPDHADGELPQSLIGSIVSVADKMDTIVGCIHVGLRPTGSQDPYGLRRKAIGVLKIIEVNQWDFALEELFATPINLFRDQNIEGLAESDLRKNLLEFFQQRTTFLLKEMSVETDVIQAVTAQSIGVFSYTIDKAKLLSDKRNDHQFKSTQEALVRVLNLAKKATTIDVNSDLFETDSEKTLYKEYKTVYPQYNEMKMERNAEAALAQLTKLTEPIHQFFEHNMVMARDEKLRHNRLALLKSIANMINDFADLTMVEWKQTF